MNKRINNESILEVTRCMYLSFIITSRFHYWVPTSCEALHVDLRFSHDFGAHALNLSLSLREPIAGLRRGSRVGARRRPQSLQVPRVVAILLIRDSKHGSCRSRSTWMSTKLDVNSSTSLDAWRAKFKSLVPNRNHRILRGDHCISQYWRSWKILRVWVEFQTQSNPEVPYIHWIK